MTEPNSPDPDDEPVIGANYPPPPPRPSAPQPPPFEDGVIGGYDPSSGDVDDDDAYYEADDYEDEEPYIDEVPYYAAPRGYESQPARQPLFYLFVAVAILIGVGAIYLLYSVVSNSGDDSPAKTPTTSTTVLVEFTSPHNGDRFKTKDQVDFTANASSNSPIEKFQLLINDRVVDEVAAAATTGTVYTGTLHTRFDTRGEYTAYVRVFTVGGAATKDTDKIKLTVIEEDTQNPASVKGKVVAEVNLRTGPGEQFDRAGTLKVGDEVTIIGRTRESDWLFIDAQGGRWVKRSAIQESAPLTTVPVRTTETTPTVSPTTTITTTPTVTPTPTQVPNSPDFVPTNAVLIDGGTKLRVTIANISTNAFNGTLVVSASGVGADPASKAFAANLGANQATTVDFDLAPPITQQKTVQVQVDPDNAIHEQNEDNNGASIVLQPPAESPALSITKIDKLSATITVTISNGGGALKGTEVTVQLTFGATVLTVKQTIALEKGQSATVSITRPAGTGPATLLLLINGQEVSAPYNFTI
jgi:hypothetical protein